MPSKQRPFTDLTKYDPVSPSDTSFEWNPSADNRRLAQQYQLRDPVGTKHSPEEEEATEKAEKEQTQEVAAEEEAAEEEEEEQKAEEKQTQGAAEEERVLYFSVVDNNTDGVVESAVAERIMAGELYYQVQWKDHGEAFNIWKLASELSAAKHLIQAFEDDAPVPSTAVESDNENNITLATEQRLSIRLPV